ncbi:MULTISPECIES: sulfur carrier protein ThiS [Proteus]|jgi:sulfur carrier protein|uniref:Thiamine biosynthesis protein n=1 Tax=Proteus vulgaris TaxID=585 RepID=A0A379F9K2_PROVU|nr:MULTISPECIES: sulfur carrier protein ThiS [Proteus]EBW1656502.1 sulfur carrier protein ThiS [Salmonella enterica subsp. enterica serovar Typhimurium]NBN58640.1 sulfur carrier protein ThiS [Proteus sp. G2639]RNT27656.1 sulfur carrier protein ThiS [Proteus mirabilis]AYY82203.1 sulfur carrier protein ThiS [Proteus vulgaris]KGA58073.1 thiamine biosynthesis protein ThiS [Proteus vulgaris]
MNITVNDEHYSLDMPVTISQLLIQLEQPLIGVALAINEIIVPRENWETHSINDGDTILLFQAIAGG